MFHKVKIIIQKESKECLFIQFCLFEEKIFVERVFMSDNWSKLILNHHPQVWIAIIIKKMYQLRP